MIGHYLMFNRNCEEALKTYEKAFGAKLVEMRKYGDMPPNPDFPVAEKDRNLVLNAQFEIAGMIMMASDRGGDAALTSGDNMYVTITAEDKAFITKAWDVLKEGGLVFYALEPTFFAELHGSMRDKFGINWMFTAMKL